MRGCTPAAAALFAAAAAVSFGLSAVPAAHAATQYWDSNGSTSGLGGSGTWTDPAGNWNDSTGTGARQTWVDGSDANFQGAASTTATPVVIPTGTTVNVGTLTFANGAGNYLIAGPGTLNVNSILMGTNTTGSARAQIISAPIAGGDLIVTANQPAASAVNSFLTLGANTATPTAAANQNLFTGNLVFAGTGIPTTLSQININNALALPTTATVLMQRDLSQLLFTAAGASGTTAYTATFNNNINANSSGSGWFTSGIGSANAGSVITLGGQISGNADMTFKVGASGGNGTIVLANPNNNWKGTTAVAEAAGTAGSLKLGVNNGLPQTTTLSLGAATAQGNFDLAGFNQTIAGLTSNGASNANVLNSDGGTSTLTISGSAVTAYAGAISNHVALVLGPANTGSLSLSGGNTYDGGTTVNGGTLLVTNTSGSATGIGPVVVGSGGRLGGAGTVSGTVTNSGNLIPGGVGTAGTLTLSGGTTLGAGSSMDLEFSATANDKLSVGTSLALPGTAQSVTLNLLDLGSAFHNQTYTLVSGAGVPAGIDTSAAGPLKVGATPTSGAARNATFTLGQNPGTNAIELTVSGVGKYLTWKGDATTGNGDIDTVTSNWDNSGTPATYSEPDDLTFNDSANGTGAVTVNLPASTNPGRLTFNTSTRNYTLQGASPLVGNASLVKTGTGTLILTAVDNSSGPISLRQGTLQVDANFNSGAAPLSFEGGTLTPSVSVNTSRTVSVVSGGGTINVAAGADSTFSGPVTGTGTLSKTGSGAITLGSANVSGLNVMAGTVTLAAATNKFGSLTIPTTAGSTSKLDIGTGTLAVGTLSETAVHGLLAAARNTGNWDGAAGLTSSAAAADPNKILGIGYFTAVDLGLSSLGSIALSPSDVILRATYYGDTNNNGIIDGDDFAAIDRGFNKGLSPRWANGDFNYDGKVDQSDYLLIDRSFGLQTGSFSADFLAMRESEFGSAYVAELVASVPEPTSLACLLAAGLIPMARRRRTRI